MATFGTDAGPSADLQTAVHLQAGGHLQTAVGGVGWLLRGDRLPAGLLSAGSLQSREQERTVVPSGFPSLDALLPAGGVRRGSLIEWLGEPADEPGGTWVAPARVAVAHEGPAAAVQEGAAGVAAGRHPDVHRGPGAGAVTLACAVAHGLAGAGTTSSGASPPRTIVVVDRAGWFHPPALLPWLAGSVSAAQLIVARPSHDDDEIWTIDQALRCPGVAAVVAWPRVDEPAPASSRSSRHDAPASRRRSSMAGCRTPARHRWATAMRRWQLAARGSGAVGLIVRQCPVPGERSWAEVRLAVSSSPSGSLLERRLRLRLIGGEWAAAVNGGAVDLVLDLARGREASAHGREAVVRPSFRRRLVPIGEEVARATA
jgi:hypothetical protein